jgi:hypothetical protein
VKEWGKCDEISLWRMGTYCIKDVDRHQKLVTNKVGKRRYLEYNLKAVMT